MTTASVSPRRWLTILMVIAAASALLATTGNAQPTPTDIIVAPGASGAGTLADPASLDDVLESRSTPPGTTIWLRGGVYEGNFFSRADGTQAAPITVRPYPGEHVVLDGNRRTDGAGLTIYGDWQVWRDLEFTNSATGRFLTSGGRRNNVYIHGRGVALINNEIHDGGNCVGWWKDAQDSLVYGNLIYNCGYNSGSRGHGHGVYIQNNDGGRKTLEANLIGATYGRSFQIFGSDQAHDIDMMDNVFAGGTSLARETKAPLYVGADVNDFRFTDNHVYTLTRETLQIEETDGGLVVEDNYLVTRDQARAAIWIRGGAPISGSGNHVAGEDTQVLLEAGVDIGAWDDNTYYGLDDFSPGNDLAGWRQRHRSRRVEPSRRRSAQPRGGHPQPLRRRPRHGRDLERVPGVVGVGRRLGHPRAGRRVPRARR